MAESNPYSDYNLVEWYNDQSHRFGDDGVQGTMDHASYYNKLGGLMKSFDPDIGKRQDRGLVDMIANYMGGYDMIARDPSNKDKVSKLAKAYQYGDYGTRPVDAIGDYWENMAGVSAYNPEEGRLADKDLFNQAKQYAQDRIATGDGQSYDGIGILDRAAPFLYEHTIGRKGILSGY